ncbi:MAG: hypothetical protein QUS35_04235 [bacterium]|nr:hypothetical protein [bacterium]
MKHVIRILLTAAAGIFLSCGSGRKGLDRLFPSPGFEKGWNWDGRPRHFTPENLYEAIDGEADLYIAYGIEELGTLLYYWGSPSDTFFVVDIYDMGSPLNAFGVYSNLRHPDYRFEDIGDEGFVHDYGMKFYKGRFLVDVKLGDFSEKCRRAALIVARETARRIRSTGKNPSLLEILPGEQQIPHTLRYVRREMLNQGFLPGGLEARYSLNGSEITCFVVFFDSSADARRGFEELRTFHSMTGQLFPAQLPGQEGLAAHSAYHGVFLAFRQDSLIAGVQDLPDTESGEPWIRSLYQRISSLKRASP